MNTPRLTVITAVRNGAAHIESAVESILNQSFRDFEYLIVDDCSDDATPKILARLAARDPRIHVLRNEENFGPYPSANKALEIARAPLIARMDGDDISEPERFARQVAFLDANPDHILVSSSYRAMNGADRTLYIKKKPADDFCVRWWMRFRMCLEHPATCFRAALPDGTPVRYDETRAVAQDYELFSRLGAFGKMAILPDVLFNYRVHTSNITSTRKTEQKANVLRIATANQQRVFDEETVQALAPMMQCYILSKPTERADIAPAVEAMSKIAGAEMAAHPERRAWIKLQTAEVLAHAFLGNGSGLRDPAILLEFGRCAGRFLPPLILRSLENKNLLPSMLQSHPRIE